MTLLTPFRTMYCSLVGGTSEELAAERLNSADLVDLVRPRHSISGTSLPLRMSFCVPPAC